jgi:hypothetical protein
MRNGIVQDYMQAKYGPTPPRKEVTADEMRELFIQDGKTESQAKFYTNIAVGLGSWVGIGGTQYRVAPTKETR